MKTKSFITGMLLVATIPVGAATNDLTSALQKGLFEEEANHNLDAAAQAYQSVSAQFDKDRKLAATAIFRLGEVYRKQGKTNEATAQYERIVREFSDQNTLVTLSRQNLAGLGGAAQIPAAVAANTATLDNLQSQYALLKAQLEQARKETNFLTIAKLLDDEELRGLVHSATYVIRTPEDQQKVFEAAAARALDYAEKRLGILQSAIAQARAPASSPLSRAARLKQTKLLEEEIQLVEQDLAELKKRVEAGVVPQTEVRAKEREVLKLRQQVAALNVDSEDVAAGTSAATPVTDDEEREIRRIQEMIKNSPDLINAPRGEEGTPLFQAATKGQLQVAAFLLDHGAAVNAVAGIRGKIWSTWTPLIGAANGGHKAIVELLLARGADANAGDDQGASALHKAAERGFKAVIEVLLAHQADVNATNRNGATPLHMAVMGSPKPVVELLLAKGANVNASIADDFNSNTRFGFISGTPLHLAARRGAPEIVALLLDHRADVNAQAKGRMSNGRTPLQAAVAQGYTEIVESLLKRGADPNAGKTDSPLVMAVRGSELKLAEILLRSGADPNLASMSSTEVHAPGAPPLYYGGGRSPGPPYGPYLPLQIATRQQNAAMLKLLLQFKADPKANSAEGVPLIFDALDWVEILTALLDAGADPNVKDRNGDRPLSFSSVITRKEIVELLLHHGADANEMDRQGWTPLQRAAGSLQKEIVAALLAHKADVNAQGSVGRTPLRLVLSLSPQPGVSEDTRQEIADLLRLHGGLEDVPDFSTIRVARGNLVSPIVVFRKDTNALNRFTLLEVFKNHYPSQPYGTSVIVANKLPFPDFSRIRILRPVDRKSAEQKEISVRMLTATNTFDCAKDMWLEFGDVIDIPEREHSLADPPGGLTGAQSASLEQCLKRTVTFIIKGQSTEIKLDGSYTITRLSGALRLPSVQNLLRSSSDLSRVKVKRTDPQTKETKEVVMDVEAFWKNQIAAPPTPVSQPSDALWLRDGDVIEVPDKP